MVTWERLCRAATRPASKLPDSTARQLRGLLLARLSHAINNPPRSSNRRTTALHGLRVEVAGAESGSGTAGWRPPPATGPLSFLCSDGRVSDRGATPLDRKSTRLNSSHMSISYAVFCL